MKQNRSHRGGSEDSSGGSKGSPSAGKSGSGRQQYPTSPDAYELVAVLGRGGMATVHLAVCMPLGVEVAVKLVDMEQLERAEEAAGGLGVVAREVAIMRELRHPNVLPLLASFTAGQHIWMVSPYYAAGSLQSIIEYAYPQGIDDWQSVATVMKEVLKALEYMHDRGRVHRDVKAANILVAADGHIVLGDFGTCATLALRDASASAPRLERPSLDAAQAYLGRDRFKGTAQYHAPGSPDLPMLAQVMKGKPLNPKSAPARPTYIFQNGAQAAKYLGRTTFVGTPCWMAPEVMAPQAAGYGTAADIWSFGITLVELATGSAPNSRRTMDQILINVLQSDDPTGIVDNIERTPEAFKEVVHSCLCKEPAHRPTATQLMQFRFFRTNALDERYLARVMLANLPPVPERGSVPRPLARTGSSGALRASSNAANVQSFGSGDGGDNTLGSRQGVSRSGASRRALRPSSNSGIAATIEPQVLDDLGTAVSLLKRLARTRLPKEELKHVLSADQLRACKGFGFAIMRRKGTFGNSSRGRGFVVAQLPAGPAGEVCWSAPSFFTGQTSATGFPRGCEEVMALYPVTKDMPGYRSGLHTISADAGHKHRHLYSCRASPSGALCSISIQKGTIEVDQCLNDAIYGEGSSPADILDGKVRPPVEFRMLYAELKAVLDGEPAEGVLERSESAVVPSNSFTSMLKRNRSMPFSFAPGGGTGSRPTTPPPSVFTKSQSMDNMERMDSLAAAGGGTAGTVSVEASSGYSAFAEARAVSRLSSGLSSSDGGQGSTPSASGQNSVQTSWQGFGPGSGAGSAQSSMQGLSDGLHAHFAGALGAHVVGGGGAFAHSARTSSSSGSAQDQHSPEVLQAAPQLKALRIDNGVAAAPTGGQGGAVRLAVHSPGTAKVDGDTAAAERSPNPSRPATAGSRLSSGDLSSPERVRFAANPAEVVALVPEKRISPTEPVSPLPAVKEDSRLDVSSSLGSSLVTSPVQIVDRAVFESFPTVSPSTPDPARSRPAGSSTGPSTSISPSNSRDSLGSSMQASAAPLPLQWTFEEDGSFRMPRKRRSTAGVLQIRTLLMFMNP